MDTDTLTLTDVDPVGSSEIVDRLGIERSTLRHWRADGRAGEIFPEPRWTVGRRPAWNWPDVAAWNKRTS